MRVCVLGPVRVLGDDGAPIDIGGARLRMLVARLALDANRPVTVEALVDGLWGAEPPADAANALQSLVSRLRRALGDASRVSSTNGGYVLKAEETDAARFEELAARGRRELAAGHHSAASATLTEALALWRGEALSDVLDAPFAQAPAARLADLLASAREDRFEAELELGRHADVLPDLETAGAAQPLRERLAGLRMRALYAAGRQSDALAVYERTRATLADELGVDPSAELQQVHLAVLRGELAKPRPVNDHLPVRLTSFVGRQRELDLLARSLASSRLVTLAGPGGAGKTRLATEAAVRHPAAERGRVWFVALAAVRDAGDVTAAVLAALGSLDMRVLNSAPSLQVVEPLDRIAELAGSGEGLLVLDNCEHLVAAAAELAHDLLTRLPNLRILATSREPLAITGELLCQLGPLEDPEAMRLFAERAATVRPGFVLDEATTEPVREICRRLDGMPLALELAAARLRSMPVQQIAKRLDDRFRLLTNGSRVALPRQRTLRAVVEWSWDLLEKPERVLARRLSIFPGGATISAVEEICGDELLPVEDVLYVLGSLVEKSIVDAVEGVEPRYRMLETIRAYGEERLDEAAERELVTRRFGAYFLRLAEENEPLLRTFDQLAAIRTFHAEHDNMLTALRRAIDAGDAETSYRFVAALCWFWVIRGLNEQPLAFLTDVLAFGEEVPADARAAFSIMNALIQAAPMFGHPENLRQLVEDCARTNALERFPILALGVPMLAFMSHDEELVERELQRALARPERWARSAAQWVRGFMLDGAGDLDGSERARAEALAGFREVGDRWGVSMTVAMQASSHSLRGRHAEAIAGYEQGLELARELSSAEDAVQQLTRLANERYRSGDVEGAWRDLEEGLRLADEDGELEHQALVRFTVLDLARCDGDFARAHEVLDWLVSVADRLPFPMRMAEEWVSMFAASLAVSEGDAATARERLPVAVSSSGERRDMPDVAIAAQVGARLLALEGKFERSAWTLGVSRAARGAFDEGDPELRELVVKLKEALGDKGFQDAFDAGASLGKEEAIAGLRAEFVD
ncbi:putative ATPase/DNA-binding SARP family transcriptional activator [Amycolatopsis bartoniae]|uniref:SARP family transcriptional regulator n=1 Tax=Amycolatopsis bartoniae TaxID=941986 RepID=A0A8H9MFT3_9PSEU|nr:BTAD domain-containing putative transcriptional regulator [Amycolatopsis bartoniae]MBB2935126.1 putative ATPase/DNA-binding SARP family transcriptional activator [Amycolatopsis bartoniae]TVT07003.1 AfsR/SARP family transcriptional regulator [Amycolatopsis bartoniae]GHF74540.1 SARP family transcriptional regulator [Amycolatopsis bartoniae]